MDLLEAAQEEAIKNAQSVFNVTLKELNLNNDYLKNEILMIAKRKALEKAIEIIHENEAHMNFKDVIAAIKKESIKAAQLGVRIF